MVCYRLRMLCNRLGEWDIKRKSNHSEAGHRLAVGAASDSSVRVMVKLRNNLVGHEGRRILLLI